MKKIYLVLIFLLDGNFIFPQAPINDIHWQCVFSETFTSLNSNTWEVQNDVAHGEPTLWMGYNSYITSNAYLTLRTKIESPARWHNDPNNQSRTGYYSY